MSRVTLILMMIIFVIISYMDTYCTVSVSSLTDRLDSSVVLSGAAHVQCAAFCCSAAALMSTAGTEWPPQDTKWTAASCLSVKPRLKMITDDFQQQLIYFFTFWQQTSRIKEFKYLLCLMDKMEWRWMGGLLSWTSFCLYFEEIHQFNFTSKLDLRSN